MRTMCFWFSEELVSAQASGSGQVKIGEVDLLVSYLPPSFPPPPLSLFVAFPSQNLIRAQAEKAVSKTIQISTLLTDESSRGKRGGGEGEEDTQLPRFRETAEGGFLSHPSHHLCFPPSCALFCSALLCSTRLDSTRLTKKGESKTHTLYIFPSKRFW